MGGTDCGFAQGAFMHRVHEEIQWAKLASLVEGAEDRLPRTVGREGRGVIRDGPSAVLRKATKAGGNEVAQIQKEPASPGSLPSR